MKHWVKQSVAALLTGLMLTTSVPISAFARGEDQQGGVVSQVDFVPSVEYGSTERETATVTYHRDGIAPPAYNVIFLVDVSWQGSGSMEQFKYLVGNVKRLSPFLRMRKSLPLRCRLLPISRK